MEQDNQQFSTPPIKKNLSFDRIIRLGFLILVFFIVILILIMTFLVIQKNNKPVVAPIQQQTVKSTPIPTQQQLTFPKIVSSSPLLLKNVPDYIKPFVLQGATKQTFITIQYADKEIGIQSTYVMPDSTITSFYQKFITEFLNSTQNMSVWSLLDTKWIGSDGYFEFQNKTLTDKVHVTFSEKDKDVEVSIQDIQTKTN
jgi:hypothetical protein